MGDYIVKQRIEKEGLYLRDCTGKETFVSSEELKQMNEAKLKAHLATVFADSIDVESRVFIIDQTKGEIVEQKPKEDVVDVEVKP